LQYSMIDWWNVLRTPWIFSGVLKTSPSESFAAFDAALSLSNTPANHGPAIFGMCFAVLFPDLEHM
jgi:hypothetical protein